MDSKKFGEFIATMRKEKNLTQADLAKKLNVTDKAVSKWERGVGFPDINSIEPLADALGVSVLEIMRSEEISETKIAHNSADAALTDALTLAKNQRYAERKSIAKIAGCVTSAVLLIFLIGDMGWLAFAMIYFPAICFSGGIALLIYGFWRRRNKLPCSQTWILAALLLSVPLSIFVFMFVSGALGIGPVPQ